MLDATLSRFADRGFSVDDAHRDSALLRAEERQGFAYSPEQRAAIDRLTRDEGIGVMVGIAGAGKSTVMAGVNEIYSASGVAVYGAALAGKAADNLQASSASKAARSRPGNTLGERLRSAPARRRLRHRRGGHGGLRADGPGDGPAQRLSSESHPRRRRASAPADRGGRGLPLDRRRDRLCRADGGPPPGARRPLRRRASSSARGRRARRWTSTRATTRSNSTRPGARLSAPRSRAGNTIAAPGRMWSCWRIPTATFSISTRWRARRSKGDGGLVGGETFLTARGPREFAPGDRVLFLDNDRTLGLCATARSAPSRRSRPPASRSPCPITPSRPAHTREGYNNIDHGYATTIHKSQGSTFDRVHVVAGGMMDAQLSYVSLSRHREEVTFHIPLDAFTPPRRPAGNARHGDGSACHREAEGHLDRLPPDAGLRRGKSRDRGASGAGAKRCCALPDLPRTACLMSRARRCPP